MSSEVSKQIQFICEEKGLNYETVIDALQTALAAAYRKDFGNKQQNIQVIFDPETGDMKIWDEKEVVEDMDLEKLEKDQEELSLRREEALKEGRELTDEEVSDLLRFNPKNEIMLSEAKEHKKSIKVGDILKIDLEMPGDFGRMAAMTAKQVIIQKLREAERETVFDDFKKQEGMIVQGVIQRRDRQGGYIVDLGKITGILPQDETVSRDRYTLGNRMKFFLASVTIGNRGPEIILSRKDKKMVEVVLEQEVPEIANEEVLIKGIARDAGSRAKVAVFTEDENIDPIGSCIGQRGSRINVIIDELGGEKIDVILFSKNTEEYIKNALAPAKIEKVLLDEANREAIAKVNSDQFSLAIGRDGQNVRLAAELTDWKISVVDLGNETEVSSEDDPEKVKDIVSEDKNEEKVAEVSEVVEEVEKVKEEKKSKTKKAKKEVKE
jgi:N utilization substance protein A